MRIRQPRAVFPRRRKWGAVAVIGVSTLLTILWWRPAAAAAQQKGFVGMVTKMPGKSFQGELPPLSATQQKLRDSLQRDLKRLAGEIGERNLGRAREYALAMRFIEGEFKKAGYNVEHEKFAVKGRTSANVVAEKTGTKSQQEILVVGAHYDTVPGCPGANDNGSGVVALLALARAFSEKKPARTVRFVAFANEEAPFYGTDSMGSFVHARGCKKRKENIVGMLSLETIGYFSDKKDSQNYPVPFSLFYPLTGNYIGFVGNVESRKLVELSVRTFRRHAKFPSEGGALPGQIDGVGWSDHWSFWQVGYPALMITDTAPFRYPHYHLATDTPDKVNYGHMSRVVEGLFHVVENLTDVSDDP